VDSGLGGRGPSRPARVLRCCAVGDFDFLVGSWNVISRRRLRWLDDCADWEESPATSTCWSGFDGLANTDEFVFADGKRGMTVRLFDRDEDQWWIHWAMPGRGTLDPPVIGGFKDGSGLFYGDDVHDDVPVKVRFVWDEISETTARWEQAFSKDGGATWEINWILKLTRVGA
jgi:hypothetical protein